MDIEALLNPEGESHILTETSDEEIYQAVMEAIEARANIEINGGDDINGGISLTLTQLTTTRSRHHRPSVDISRI